MTFDFDIAVVGGGHAGIEAALAAARTRSANNALTAHHNALRLLLVISGSFSKQGQGPHEQQIPNNHSD
jgi:tRNA U34 5-carboxymethylaminomethyl modifying enzyme MnmG/GidA